MKEDERGQSLRGESWRLEAKQSTGTCCQAKLPGLDWPQYPAGLQPDSGLPESVKNYVVQAQLSHLPRPFRDVGA